jgi:hypothetical protein
MQEEQASSSKAQASRFKLQIGFLLLLVPLALSGQNGWLPASREMERSYSLKVAAPGSNFHSAIRPWRLKELQTLAPDSSIGSIVPALDRWADTSHAVRWGPLLDASAGYDAANGEAIFHRTGAGLWIDADAGRDWSFHVDGQLWSEKFPDYLDRFVFATQATPGEGFAFGSERLNLGDAIDYYHYDRESSSTLPWAAGRIPSAKAIDRFSFPPRHRVIHTSASRPPSGS